VGTLNFTKTINTSTLGLPASSGISVTLCGIKDKEIYLVIPSSKYSTENPVLTAWNDMLSTLSS
jgi:hypothetical protein